MPIDIDQRIAAVLAVVDNIDASDKYVAAVAGLMSHHAAGALEHALERLAIAGTAHAEAATARAREIASAAIHLHHRDFGDAAEAFNGWLERALAVGSREVPALDDVQCLFAACRKLTDTIKLAIDVIPTPADAEGPDPAAVRLVLLVVASLAKRAQHAHEQAAILIALAAKAETGEGRRAALDGVAEHLADLERFVAQLGEWTAKGDALGDASTPAIDLEPLREDHRRLADALDAERAALEACTAEPADA